MATTVCSIVESAYRATLEEQDDTILWLNHMLKNNGLDVTIVLRANAVNYAVRGQDASGLRFGNTALAHPPAPDRDLIAMLEKGVPVHFVSEDITERGIAADRIIDGAKPVRRSELAEMLHGYDHVWHW
jgi:hypothetical protein